MPISQAKPPLPTPTSSRITLPHALTPSPCRRVPSKFAFTQPCSGSTHRIGPASPPTCSYFGRLDVTRALDVQSRNQRLRSITGYFSS
ncbi:hypothetical protein V6N13_102279 [Hibiscus sabdariffa]|uniref:Uncharacterized protein n=2 Tax=Hibiscus sabdariffa TaxID=183260 RepID=A0ABR1Z886_9ROSI